MLDKPSKPTPLYALRAHSNGKYYRKIKGTFHYFGKWDDPNLADAEYGVVARDLSKGLPRFRPPDPVRLQLWELADRFVVYQERRFTDGDIGPRQFSEYRRSADRFAELVGRELPASAIEPHHLESYRSELRKTLKALALRREMTNARAMLRWAGKTKLMDRDHSDRMADDDALSKPPDKEIRRDRNANETRDGKPVFTRYECRRILLAAGQPLESMILLAINGGFGQADCSSLNLTAVDLENAYIDTIRVKTEVARQVTLWPETVEALSEWIANRPAAANPEDDLAMFITRFGRRWVRNAVANTAGRVDKVTPIDGIAHEFEKLLESLGIDHKGRGFYGLRRTFATFADNVPDRNARLRIMGQELQGNDPHYVRRMPAKRLKRITDYVRHAILISSLTKKKTSKQRELVS